MDIKINETTISSLEHLTCVLDFIIDGTDSVHNMGSLSDYLLENAHKILNNNNDMVKPYIEDCIIQSCHDLRYTILNLNIVRSNDINDLDYRVKDWINGSNNVINNNWSDESPKIEFDADEYSILESALRQYQKDREYDYIHNDEFAREVIGPIKNLREKLEQYCEKCSDWVCDNINKGSK